MRNVCGTPTMRSAGMRVIFSRLASPAHYYLPCFPSLNMVDDIVTAQQILLYIPNLIGYTRVILTLSSLTLMIISPSCWALAIALYVASFVGDLFDGMAARKLGQTSTFGGLIDMVTDRCSTTGLLCVLIREFANQSGYVLVSCVQF